MSQVFKKKKRESGLKKNQKSPIKHEDDYIHLQTILMMSQLNTAYYDLQLRLSRTFEGLKNQYHRLKLQAFIKIQHYQPDSIDIRSFTLDYQREKRRRYKALIEDELELSLLQDQQINKDGKRNSNRVEEAVQCRIVVNCKMILAGLAKRMEKKRRLSLSWGWHHLILHAESTSNRIMSEKSSKIETSDTKMNKIFKRSVERKSNRKSFSLEKSTVPRKHEYYVPVKFKSSKQQTKSQQHIAEYTNSSAFNKFLQDKGEVNTRESKNSLAMNREKNLVKVNSSKKLSMSMVGGEKQEKIRELQCLKTKYKKLMDQFNWFSERFKKVIEEEDEVE